MPWHGPNGDPLSAGFRAMPRSPNIEDRRAEGPDYTVDLRRSQGNARAYWPSNLPGESPWGPRFSGYDPLVAAPLMTSRVAAWGPGDPYWTLPERKK